MINDAFKNLFNVIVITYLNDILIYLEDFTKYEEYVKQVLKCLIKHKLWFKFKKCKWLKKKVKFLKFIIKKNLIWINFNKLKAIYKWKTLINVKEI